MNIPDKAVEAAMKAWLAHKSVRSHGNGKAKMRAALEAAAPEILRSGADYLEGRLEPPEPTTYGEQQYLAGYADAVARIFTLAKLEGRREPKTPTGLCYVRHEVAPGAHMDIPHTHEDKK
jgi:hypothetical protein